MTYELHYRGFDDVSPDAEWDLGILALRRQLERRFEEQLRAVTASAEVPLDTDVGEVLLDLATISGRPQHRATAATRCNSRSDARLPQSAQHRYRS